MAFFNQLLNYLWQILTFVGGITAAVGVFRWVSGGKAHDAQAQEGAVWVIALGGAMAAIGLKQLERYPSMLERRREIIGKYDAMCDELGVKHLVHYTKDSTSSGHLYLTRIPGITDAQRREIIMKLAERGVSTNVHYKPLPMMTAYKALGWDIKDFPNAYAYYENLITLPLHTKLTDEEVDYVIETYCMVLKEYIK